MGVFTVKGGYLSEIGYLDPHEHTSATNGEDWKRLVWHLNIPPKVKMFIWRVLLNFVATPMNLRAHHINMGGICEFCRKEWGTTGHVLFFCQVSKFIWKRSKFWPLIKKLKNVDMLEMRKRLSQQLSRQDFELWAVVVYSTWTFLCQIKHQPDSPHKQVCVEGAATFLQSFQEARHVLRVECSLGVKLGRKHWNLPENRVFRLDVDAAVNNKTQLSGVGAVVRDCKDKIRAALAKSTLWPSSVVEAEINAVLYSVGLCLQEGLVPFVVYSDSILAVRLLSGGNFGENYVQQELTVLEEVINNGFVLEFRHMYREANLVAHRLARFGATCNDFVIWNSSFPPWLKEMIE